jgi:hypothetical protein
MLYDILPPSIDSISIPIDSFIVLMESTPITFGFNEKVDSLDFVVTSKALDSVKFDFIRGDSSLSLMLQPPFASHDSITVNFSYLEDEAGLSTVDIAYTYTTPILGDYDFDSKITYNDLWDLVENWEMKNFNYELGPVSGQVPHFISIPDSKFDIEDGMAFVQIWSWYQKEYGQIVEDTVMIGKPLNIAQLGNELSIFIEDSIASGQIQFSNNHIDSRLRFSTKSYDGAMYLSHQNPEKGYSILEFARPKIMAKDTIRVTADEESKLKIYYKFYGRDKKEIQRGHISFEYSTIPTTLDLYPAYPNPFNPVTTLQFDIPHSENTEKVSLSIFDLMGREIDMLINGNKPPCSYKFKWNATKHSSGVYFARLRLGPYVKTQKIILMK